jgi:hypothetical protein
MVIHIEIQVVLFNLYTFTLILQCAHTSFYSLKYHIRMAHCEFSFVFLEPEIGLRIGFVLVREHCCHASLPSKNVFFF